MQEENAKRIPPLGVEDISNPKKSNRALRHERILEGEGRVDRVAKLPHPAGAEVSRGGGGIGYRGGGGQVYCLGGHMGMEDRWPGVAAFRDGPNSCPQGNPRRQPPPRGHDWTLHAKCHSSVRGGTNL